MAGNVKVVKAKAGMLAIAKSVSTGELVIGGGTVKAVTNAVPEAFAGLTLHLDASRPETIVRDGDGYVLEWHSTVGGVVLTPQSDKGNNPFYSVNAYGDHPAITFGQTKAVASSGNALVGDRSICHKTIIVVNRPKAEMTSNLMGLYGGWHVNFGIRRETVSAYYWDDEGGVFEKRNGDLAYVNGVLEYDPANGLTPNNGTYYWSANWGAWSRTAPHVLTAITAESDVDKTTVTPAVGSYFTNWTRAWVGDVHEIIVYDRVLTADERNTIETALMSKWGILGNVNKTPAVTELGNVLSPDSAVRVTGDSTVDFGGMDQVIPALLVDAKTASCPQLTITGVIGPLDLSTMDFALSCETDLTARQSVLNVPSGLTGSFKSENVPEGVKVKYGATEVFVSAVRGLILLFR